MKKILLAMFLNIFFGFAASHSMNLIDDTTRAPQSPPSRAHVEVFQKISNQYNLEVAFQPQSDNLAAASKNDKITIFNWKNKKIVKKLSLGNGADMVLQAQIMSFSPEGKFMAVCHSRTADQKVLTIWRTTDWQIIKDLEDSLTGTGCVALTFSPDSRRLYIISNRKTIDHPTTILALESDSWKELFNFSTTPFQPKLIRVSPDSKTIAIVGEVLNLPSWQGPGVRPEFGNPPLPDGGFLLTIDANNQKIKAVTNLSQSPTRFSSLSWRPKTDIVSIAYGLGMENINVLTRENSVSTNPTDLNIKTFIEYSPDGNALVESVRGKNINWLKIYDTSHEHILYQDDSTVQCGAFSPDGKYLATGNESEIKILKITK